MALDRKEVDLIIRSVLEGRNTVPQLTRSVQDLEKAVVAQAEAAERGEVAFDELRSTQARLKQVQDQLKGVADLIADYNRLSAAIDKTQERLTASQDAYGTLRTEIEASGQATKRQENRLASLERANTRYTDTLARQQTSLAALRTSLNAAGVEVSQLASAENQVRASATQLAGATLTVNQAMAGYAVNVRKAKEAQRQLADDNAFERMAQQANQLVRAAQYVELFDQAIQQEGFRRAADDALNAARGYRTLATSVGALNTPVRGLRDTLQGIIAPTQQGRETLQGLEAQVQELGRTVSAIKGPVQDYSNLLRQAAAVQKSLADKAGLVDAYQRELSALRAARTEYSAARAQVNEYSAALRNSATANDEVAQSLAAAQSRLQGAANAIRTQIQTTRQVRESARAAGIATRDLASSQDRLVSAARESTTILQQLTQQQKRYGDETKRTKSSLDLLSNSGRTTLSFFQRMRGEILALGASYIGIYGAINQADKAIDAMNAKQAIMNQLSISVGDNTRAIANEYAYLQGQADRLGVEFESLASSYAKFSAAATLSGRSRQEIRYIFETFASVGRVMNLTAENMDGVFKALEQVMSKGTIQAEELRGQLGDRLFGAFEIAAKALKDQFPDLQKAMKDGLVTADNLVLIAEQYYRMIAEQLPEATESLAAQQARLNNALFEFRTLVSEQGLGRAYSESLVELTKFFRSRDGERFAERIGNAFAAILDTFIWLARNIDTVMFALKRLATVWAGLQLLRWGASLVTLYNSFTLAATGATLFGKAVTFVQRAFLPLAAILATITFAQFLSETKSGQKVLLDFFGVIDSLGVRIVAFKDMVVAELSSMPRAIAAVLRTALPLALQPVFDVMVGYSGLVAEAPIADIRKRADAEIAKIKAEVERQKAEIDASSESQGPRAGATEFPGLDRSGAAAKIDAETQKAADRRKNLIESIQQELQTIESRVNRAENDSWAARLRAIELSYGRLAAKIAEVGGEEAATFKATLDRLKAELIQQENDQFLGELDKAHDSINKKIRSMQSSISKTGAQELANRLEGVRNQYAQVFAEIDEQLRLQQANDLNTAGTERQRAEAEANLNVLLQLEEMEWRQQRLNDLVRDRDALIDAEKNKLKTGLQNEVQMRENVKAIIESTQPQIAALADDTIRFLEQYRELFDPEAWQIMVNKIELARDSVEGIRTEAITAADVVDLMVDGFTTGATSITKSIGNAIVGLQSWKDTLLDVRDAFLQFAADFLLQLGQMILKVQLLKALQGVAEEGGVLDTAIGVILGAGQSHDGGLAGAPKIRRRVMMSMPKFHNGGLSSDETMAVLRKNEEVLTRDDPRHVMNGGRSAGSDEGVKIINTFDSASFLKEALATTAGKRILVNAVSANAGALQQALKVGK